MREGRSDEVQKSYADRSDEKNVRERKRRCIQGTVNYSKSISRDMASFLYSH